MGENTDGSRLLPVADDALAHHAEGHSIAVKGRIIAQTGAAKPLSSSSYVGHARLLLS